MSFWNSWFGKTNDVPIILIDKLSHYGISVQERKRLHHWIRDAKRCELRYLNPYYLADQLQLSRQRILELLAPAVITGLFHLNWDVLCPACGNIQHAFDSLPVARSQHSCLACGGNFAAHLDDEIIVTFSVNETIRSDAKEDLAWRQKIDQQYGYFTGHQLLTVQVFRDLFVNEPLPTNESFQIRKMTLLFTDLVGSTALYARKGDPLAYGLVREHFCILQEVINQHKGSIVKTIGDAVMAVFATSDQALQAALQTQKAMQRFNRERKLLKEDQLHLKVGLHTGPCLMVTLNDRLDYFGTTVNVAARVQASAKLREILFTDEVISSLTTLQLLDSVRLSKERLILRGLEKQSFIVYRTKSALENELVYQNKVGYQMQNAYAM